MDTDYQTLSPKQSRSSLPGVSKEDLTNSNKCTPVKPQKQNDLADDEADKDLDIRRARLLRQLKDHDKTVEFDNMLRMIGLEDRFDQFEKVTDGIFMSLVEQLPVFSSDKLVANSSRPSFKNAAAGAFDYSIAQSGESALVSLTKNLLSELKRIINTAANNNTPLKEFMDFSPRYRVVDHQKTKVAQSLHKPDLAFYFQKEWTIGFKVIGLVLEAKIDPTLSQIPDDTLGQLADYGNALWMAQPTRTFAPVLYLHGPYLELILFYRSGWYRVEIGNICLLSHTTDQTDLDDIHSCFQQLMFLTNLPLESFGHFCGVSELVTELFFAPRLISDASVAGDTVLKTAGTASLANSVCVKIRSPMTLPISIYGRVGYLYHVVYSGKRAVLKMAWSPANRTPEGAVYDLLHRHHIKHVPKVYNRGILIENLDGYRLEYLVIEDCGQTIDAYLKSLSVGLDHGQVVRSVVEQVTECLASARAIGVLHRDISTGNIAVKDGVTSVIDWEYAKITDDSVDGASEIAELWGFSPKDVEYGFNDALTGTVAFMSISVLSLSSQRSFFDDIESLFYVILRVYSAKTHDGKEPVG
ncbi:hypothetical protein H4R99_008251, partial [Coemansia sp. RSA 1722]